MPQSSNDMNGKEWLEFIKAYNEFLKEQKPKDDKKPVPGDWTPWDHLTFILFFQSIFIVIGTCVVLHYLTEFTKALH